jgi:hypothetical protein
MYGNAELEGFAYTRGLHALANAAPEGGIEQNDVDRGI